MYGAYWSNAAYRFPLVPGLEIQDPRSLGCLLHAVSISARHITVNKSFPYKLPISPA